MYYYTLLYGWYTREHETLVSHAQTAMGFLLLGESPVIPVPVPIIIL